MRSLEKWSVIGIVVICCTLLLTYMRPTPMYMPREQPEASINHLNVSLYVESMPVHVTLANGQDIIKLIQDLTLKPRESGGQIEKEEDEWIAKMNSRYKERQDLLRKVCEKRKVLLEDATTNVLQQLNKRFISRNEEYTEHIDLSHYCLARPFKTMGCFINKVASSSLTTAFLQTGYEAETQEEWLFSPHMLNPHLWPKSYIEFNYVNHTYFKFMVVRHPLERVLSAYRNKIQNASHPSLIDFRNHVLNTVRKGVEYVVSGNDTNSTSEEIPSFTEFIRYILLGNIEGNGFESHWVPYWKYCAPCHIRFNVIGKLETAREDLKFIWDRTGLKTKTKLSWTNKSKSYNDNLNMYKQLPTDVLLNFYKKFRLDFEMFGYSMADILKKLNRKVPPDVV